MRAAAADLDFEKAARLRDEIKRLRAAELAVVDDPTAKRPGPRATGRRLVSLPHRGGSAAFGGRGGGSGAASGGGGAGTRARKPTLDEMGPHNRELPLAPDDVRPGTKPEFGKGKGGGRRMRK